MEEPRYAGAATAAGRVVADAMWTKDTIDVGHALRVTPPVNLLRQVKEHRNWEDDDFVLRVARRNHGVFTSTSTAATGQLHKCEPEDFVYVYEPLGVLACLKHMVVHRCGESWQRLRQWINLPNNASSLQCRRIRLGKSNEPSWCCAFSRKRLPDADALEMNVSSIHSSADLAAMVYGTGMQSKRQETNAPALVGGTLKRSGSQKRCFDDAFHTGVKRHTLLKQTISVMVKALVDPQKRAKYNGIIQERGGRGKLLNLQELTPGIQLVLRHRLIDLCERLLEELKKEKIDMNSLVFFALRVTAEGPQFGKDAIASPLPVRRLRPLPMETMFEEAFGLSLRNYSKTATKITRVIGDTRFARQMGWCVALGEKSEAATRCRESKSDSPLSSLSSSSSSPSPE